MELSRRRGGGWLTCRQRGWEGASRGRSCGTVSSRDRWWAPTWQKAMGSKGRIIVGEGTPHPKSELFGRRKPGPGSLSHLSQNTLSTQSPPAHSRSLATLTSGSRPLTLGGEGAPAPTSCDGVWAWRALEVGAWASGVLASPAPSGSSGHAPPFSPGLI